MFHGIEMQVVHVRCEIPFISDQMLPESALPQGEVRVAWQKFDHAVQTIGQNHNRALELLVPRGMRRNALRLLRPTRMLFPRPACGERVARRAG